jgi:YggT family protein
VPGALAVLIDDLLRLVVLGALIAALAVALTHGAVRARRLQPFAAWPRFVRKWSDPLLDPIERQLVRAGRNPQEAPLWLVGIVVLGGILLLTLTRWLVRFLYSVAALRYAGLLGVLAFLIDLAFNILILAILVRVVGSWLGAARYTRAVRWAYRLTDWIVEPIRRRIPPVGPLDLSPLVAFVALLFLQAVLLAVLR